MLDPQLLATLRSLPLFAGIPQPQLERIARITRVMRVDPGAVIFNQWDIARGFYMLISGAGQLIQQGSDGGQRLLANVLPGQYFNEAALTTELVEQATFVITMPSLLLTINRADYIRLPVGTEEVGGMTVPAATAAHTQPVHPAAQETVPGSSPSVQATRASVPSNAQLTRAQSPLPAAGQQPPAASAYAQQSAAAGRPASVSAQRPAAQSSRPQWLNPGETIMLQTRRHWWVVVRNIVVPMMVLVALVIASFIAQTTFLRLLIIGGAVALTGSWMLYVFFDWRNDWLVITDERVLRVEQQVARFSIQTMEVGLLSVQAVSATLRPGDPMARVLRYGDVVINTAGSAGNIMMDFVPNPSSIKDYVFHQREIKMRAQGYAVSGQQPQTPGGMEAQEQAQNPNAFSEDDSGGHLSPAVGGGGLFTMRYINKRGEMVYRRHLIIWAVKVSFPIGMFFIALLVLLLGNSWEWLAQFGAVKNIGAVIAMIFAALWFYLADWDWRNDLYIIGDNVITLLYRSPLLLQFREDQVLIQRIHNIEAETTGLLRSLLDYGDVRVLLLGDEQPKVFRDVPSPVSVREEISRRQRIAAEAAQQAEQDRQMEALMARMQAQGFGVVAQNAAPQPNPTGQPPTPGQVAPPASEYRPPVQPQRPPIPRRRV